MNHAKAAEARGFFNSLLTDDQHMAALLTIERVNPMRKAALARMAKVTQTLGHALRDGKIKFALLPTRGGEFIPETKPFWWNIPTMAHRWKRCQMSPADPYSVAFAGAGFMHIFVDAIDFAALAASLPKPEAAAQAPAPPMQRKSNKTHAVAKALLANWEHPSPTRPLFIALCKENGISSTTAYNVYRGYKRRGRTPA